MPEPPTNADYSLYRLVFTIRVLGKTRDYKGEKAND
jgi:hypothetical protein